MELFVSYAYVGKQFGNFYEGFGNAVIKPINDDDYTFIENLTNEVNEIAKVDNGMDTIICTVLYFKEFGA